ncbi:hypothetical protein F4777DRAFT_353058 [Nemania sp. FL0916]|nr:hypothetical protein F4777DRAFT_353058 [Nemania sp. FL0916]
MGQALLSTCLTKYLFCQLPAIAAVDDSLRYTAQRIYPSPLPFTLAVPLAHSFPTFPSQTAHITPPLHPGRPSPPSTLRHHARYFAPAPCTLGPLPSALQQPATLD